MKTPRGWVVGGLGALLAAAGLQAAGFVVVDEAHWWPPGLRPPIEVPPPRPLPPPPRHRFAPLELSRLEAKVRVADQSAEVTLEQEFRNPNPNRMEGHFLLPLPRNAQLTGLTLTIDGRPVEAELLAADKARSIYEDIVRKLKDPALLEYEGQGLYRVRIFPVEPGGTRTVSVRYEQWLPADQGLVEFRLPLGGARWSPRPIPVLKVDLELATRLPLKSVYSPTHPTLVERRGEREAVLRVDSREVRPEGDLQLFFARDSDPVGVHLLTHRAPDGPGTFLLLLSPGWPSAEGRIVPKDVVFVVDTSGSMAGGKLEQAKRALSFCIENLNEEDRFEVVRFSTEAEGMFGALTRAGQEARKRATDFIGRLKPMGGTAIEAALEEALGKRLADSRRPLVVIFLTDGRPTVGEVGEDRIVARVQERNEAGTRVFCFGIGHDVNAHLLDKLTEVTRGSSQYVLPEEDLELKVSGFYARIKDPVLVEPRLEWGEGVRVSQVMPARLPDLFRGEQVVVAGRYEGAGDVAVRLIGEMDGRRETTVHEVQFPRSAPEHGFIPRLWATRRVGYLLDQIRLHGDQAELREEVVDLARRYGIVTPYTALLIVEDETRRGVAARAQSLPNLQRDEAGRAQVDREVARVLSERYGLAQVARARSDDALKSAAAPAAALQMSQVEAARSLAAGAATSSAGGGGATASSGARVTLENVQGQAQFAGGRVFFWNADRWLDAGVQDGPDGERWVIRLGSPEYFELAREHAEVGPWLALGQRVEFRWGDRIVLVEP